MKSRVILERVLLVGLSFVTLVMAPYNSIDPVNVPKLSALVFFGIVAASLVAIKLKKAVATEHRVIICIIFLFIVDLSLVIIFGASQRVQQIYGTSGRNSGALAYLGLALFMFASLFVSNHGLVRRFILTTIPLGAILVAYGEAQHQGLDPFPFVNGYASNVFGTFGNPDFMSAFMGLLAVVSFTMA